MRCVVVFGGAWLFLACSATKSYDGPHATECSNGPPVTTYPPPGNSTSSGPECVPHCGYAEKYRGGVGEAYALQALPSGTCPYDGEVCGMAASTIARCPGEAPTTCDLSLFECRCEGGTWQCVTVSQGAGVCACVRDGGADGG